MNAVIHATPINAKATVETEKLGLVTVLGSMLFHAGYSRQLELENQNPQSPTTKVYVSLLGHGLFIANAVEDPTAVGGFRLTHLKPMESVKGFMKQISREVDRKEEGKVFLLSTWSMI